jgi:hypothetical protein
MRGLLLLALLGASPVVAADVQDMAGNWTVDLRPKLTGALYTQPMVLKIAADGGVTGSFYNSEILAGRSVSARDRNCVAFRTTDGSGFYHSSACLEGGKMVGTTWAEGRNFLFPWTAER